MVCRREADVRPCLSLVAHGTGKVVPPSFEVQAQSNFFLSFLKGRPGQGKAAQPKVLQCLRPPLTLSPLSPPPAPWIWGTEQKKSVKTGGQLCSLSPHSCCLFSRQGRRSKRKKQRGGEATTPAICHLNSLPHGQSYLNSWTMQQDPQLFPTREFGLLEAALSPLSPCPSSHYGSIQTCTSNFAGTNLLLIMSVNQTWEGRQEIVHAGAANPAPLPSPICPSHHPHGISFPQAPCPPLPSPHPCHSYWLR